jgi:septal ring factor EnvC (AmiA/AmiB activator)
MAVPDGGEALSLWQQAWAGLALLIVTVLSQAWRYFTSLKDKDPPSHVVLEQADIADMRPLRELSAQMQREFPAIRQEQEKMLEILHRIDQRVGTLEEDQRVERRADEKRFRERIAEMEREERDRNR